MWQQLLQVGIAVFAGACALMVVRTVVEVLPELVGLSRTGTTREPLPVPVGAPTARPRRRA